jgi:hypothetical protein
MERQEGYYWVKYYDKYIIAEYKNVKGKMLWHIHDIEDSYSDKVFDYINEVRIKQPGELPE